MFNYGQFSNSNVTAEPAVNIAEEVVEEVTEEVEAVEETEEIGEENEIAFGTVECKNKLNVRKAPIVGAPIATEIKNGSMVEINLAESTEEFYKVCTEKGVEGFCMKKFIKLDA